VGAGSAGASGSGTRGKVMMSSDSRAPVDGDVEGADFALALQALRMQAGGVSYNEIASRITRHRASLGMSPAAAHVARSSVYDAFRPGRTRFNPDLIEQIALALGESSEGARAWRIRSLEVQVTAQRIRAAGSPQTQPTSVAAPDVALARVMMPATPPMRDSPGSTRLGRVMIVLAIMIACVAINTLGNAVIAKFQLPVWLDMVGTATASLALGPWFGAAVGLATNLLAFFAGTQVGIPYALVNVVGALIWGYGVRGLGLGRTPLRFLLLNMLVALGCTVVAVPITIAVLGVETGHTTDTFMAWLVALGGGLWTSVFAVNMLASLVDKLISGYFALWVTRSITPQLLPLGGRFRPLEGFAGQRPVRRPRRRAEA